MTAPEHHRLLCRTLLHIGGAALVNGRIESADRIFDGLRALEPGQPGLELLPASSLLMQGQYAAALQYLQYCDPALAGPLVASCHILLGSADWRAHANALLERPIDGKDRAMLQELLGPHAVAAEAAE